VWVGAGPKLIHDPCETGSPWHTHHRIDLAWSHGTNWNFTSPPGGVPVRSADNPRSPAGRRMIWALGRPGSSGREKSGSGPKARSTIWITTSATMTTASRFGPGARRHDHPFVVRRGPPRFFISVADRLIAAIIRRSSCFPIGVPAEWGIRPSLRDFFPERLEFHPRAEGQMSRRRKSSH
jgi:hypothetical protein